MTVNVASLKYCHYYVVEKRVEPDFDTNVVRDWEF